MTPAEHYAEAESLLADVHDLLEHRPEDKEPKAVRWAEANRMLMEAQVHASLANAEPWPLRGVVSSGHAQRAEFVEHVYKPPVGVCATCGLPEVARVHVDTPSWPKPFPCPHCHRRFESGRAVLEHAISCAGDNHQARSAPHWTKSVCTCALGPDGAIVTQDLACPIHGVRDATGS